MAGDVRLDALTRAEAERQAAAHAGLWRVVDRQETVTEEALPPPYTLADLLADAAERLGWPAERTAETAQRLFVEGWITYPRTDSVRVAPQAVQAARQAITAEYGAEWLGKPVSLSADPSAQDAHEAVRPTDPGKPAEELTDPELQVLYRLIRSRFLAAFMRPARVRQVTVTLEKADG